MAEPRRSLEDRLKGKKNPLFPGTGPTTGPSNEGAEDRLKDVVASTPKSTPVPAASQSTSSIAAGIAGGVVIGGAAVYAATRGKRVALPVTKSTKMKVMPYHGEHPSSKPSIKGASLLGRALAGQEPKRSSLLGQMISQEPTTQAPAKQERSKAYFEMDEHGKYQEVSAAGVKPKAMPVPVPAEAPAMNIDEAFGVTSKAPEATQAVSPTEHVKTPGEDKAQPKPKKADKTQASPGIKRKSTGAQSTEAALTEASKDVGKQRRGPSGASGRSRRRPRGGGRGGIGGLVAALIMPKLAEKD